MERGRDQERSQEANQSQERRRTKRTHDQNGAYTGKRSRGEGSKAHWVKKFRVGVLREPQVLSEPRHQADTLLC